jgi:hypothetical protein
MEEADEEVGINNVEDIQVENMKTKTKETVNKSRKTRKQQETEPKMCLTKKLRRPKRRNR